MQDPFRNAEPKVPLKALPKAPIDTPGSDTPPRATRKARFGPDLQAQIGDHLRTMHHDVLSEKVPDRFVQLLQELAEKEAKRT
jgi:hypothetical protein